MMLIDIGTHEVVYRTPKRKRPSSRKGALPLILPDQSSVVGHTYSVRFTSVSLMALKPPSTSTKSSQPRCFRMLAAIMLR